MRLVERVGERPARGGRTQGVEQEQALLHRMAERQSGLYPRWAISTPPQRSFRYSATSRRWQW